MSEKRIEQTQLDRIPANLAVGARLGVAATIFVYFGPFFAYFYLRSLNSAGLWRPAGVDAPQAFGVAITLVFVASAAALSLASARAARERPWMGFAAGSLALGLAGVALQVIEYTRLGFRPLDGGYASVFVGWTALTAAFALVSMGFLEAQLAYALRHRDAPLAVLQPRLAAVAFYWACLAAFAVVMWVVLYLV